MWMLYVGSSMDLHIRLFSHYESVNWEHPYFKKTVAVFLKIIARTFLPDLPWSKSFEFVEESNQLSKSAKNNTAWQIKFHLNKYHTDWVTSEDRSRTNKGKLKGDKTFAGDRKTFLTISSSSNWLWAVLRGASFYHSPPARMSGIVWGTV